MLRPRFPINTLSTLFMLPRFSLASATTGESCRHELDFCASATVLDDGLGCALNAHTVSASVAMAARGWETQK